VKIKAFTIAATVMALLFWTLEAAIHFYLFDEPQFEIFPTETNELWMRSVIVVLIVCLGISADLFIDRIVHKQLDVAHTYSAMIHTSRHILINIVNQMQLFKLEAQKSKDFDKEVIKYYDSTIKEASDLIETLAKVRDATKAHKEEHGIVDSDTAD
jgi:hypothetical protein